MVVDLQRLSDAAAAPVGSDDRLDDRQYSLLARAVTSRWVQVRTSDVELAYYDGEAIHLPAEGSACHPDGRSVLIGVAVQSALIAGGSLDPAFVKRLLGHPVALRRYLTLEAARSVSALHYCVPRAVASAVSTHWAGVLPLSPDDSLSRALNGERIPVAPEAFGTVRPRRLLAGVSSGPGFAPTADHAVRAARSALTPELDEDEDETESEEFPTLLKLFSQGSSKPWGMKWLQNLFGLSGGGRQERLNGKGGADDLPIGVAKRVDHLSPHAKYGVVSDLPSGLSRPPERFGEVLYPEWDWRSDSYLLNWTSVSEYDPPFADSTDSIKINSDLRLRRAISRLGLTYERHDRQSDGDGLSVDSLVQLAVSRALGEPGDDRIYEARLRTAHDLGVLVLLDSSGSTDERTTQGLLVWEAQRQLAANLVSILEEVGARVAAFGFNSQGRHIRFLRIKDFDDRFDQTSRRRLVAIAPTGLTRLGGAIRHGSKIVATRAGTQNLLLVLVSDGFPYENDEYQGSYAEHDTRRALEEAVAGGVGCACVAVASSTGDEALERLWGTIPHARLLHADHFGKYAEPLLRSAIQRADRRDRTESKATSPTDRGPRNQKAFRSLNRATSA